MGNGTLITVTLVLGALLGLAAGRLVGGSPPVDAELQGQMAEISRRLSELDQRISARSAAAPAPAPDTEQIVNAVRTALAERDVASARPPACDTATAPSDSADAPPLSRAQRENLTSLLRSNASPDELQAALREVMRSIK